MKKRLLTLCIIAALCLGTAVPAAAQSAAADEVKPATAFLTMDAAAQPGGVALGDFDQVGKPLSEAGRRVYNAVVNYESRVDLSGLGIAANEDVIWDLLNEAMVYDPIAYFAMTNTNGFGYSYDSNNHLVTLLLARSETKEEYDARRAALQAATDEALAVVNDTMTDEEKALALHDYLVATIDYDQYGIVGSDDQTPYGALVEKACVCNGYAAAYNMLLSFCGIPSIRVVSDAMNHAWSMIQLDGSWYHVDPTFDDPLGNTPGMVFYDYFLLTDAEISDSGRLGESGVHYDWNANGLTATNTAYAHLPRDTYSHQNGGLYSAHYSYTQHSWIFEQSNAATGDNNIVQTDFRGNNQRILVDADVDCLLVDEPFIYYGSGHDICRYDMAYQSTETLFTLTDAMLGDWPEWAKITSLDTIDDGTLFFTYYRVKGNIGTYINASIPVPARNIPLKSLRFAYDKAYLIVGNTLDLKLIADPQAAIADKTVTYTSSNPSVIYVQDGTLFSSAAGTAVITAEVGGKTASMAVTTVYAGDALGNVDGKDEQINASDALLALRHSVKEIDLSQASNQWKNGADIRANVTKQNSAAPDTINASDALQILRYSVKEIMSFD